MVVVGMVWRVWDYLWIGLGPELVALLDCLRRFEQHVLHAKIV